MEITPISGGSGKTFSGSAVKPTSSNNNTKKIVNGYGEQINLMLSKIGEPKWILDVVASGAGRVQSPLTGPFRCTVIPAIDIDPSEKKETGKIVVLVSDGEVYIRAVIDASAVKNHRLKCNCHCDLPRHIMLIFKCYAALKLHKGMKKVEFQLLVHNMTLICPSGPLKKIPWISPAWQDKGVMSLLTTYEDSKRPPSPELFELNNPLQMAALQKLTSDVFARLLVVARKDPDTFRSCSLRFLSGISRDLRRFFATHPPKTRVNVFQALNVKLPAETAEIGIQTEDDGVSVKSSSEDAETSPDLFEDMKSAVSSGTSKADKVEEISTQESQLISNSFDVSNSDDSSSLKFVFNHNRLTAKPLITYSKILPRSNPSKLFLISESQGFVTSAPSMRIASSEQIIVDPAKRSLDDKFKQLQMGELRSVGWSTDPRIGRAVLVPSLHLGREEEVDQKTASEKLAEDAGVRVTTDDDIVIVLGEVPKCGNSRVNKGALQQDHCYINNENEDSHSDGERREAGKGTKMSENLKASSSNIQSIPSSSGVTFDKSHKRKHKDHDTPSKKMKKHHKDRPREKSDFQSFSVSEQSNKPGPSDNKLKKSSSSLLHLFSSASPLIPPKEILAMYKTVNHDNQKQVFLPEDLKMYICEKIRTAYKNS